MTEAYLVSTDMIRKITTFSFNKYQKDWRVFISGRRFYRRCIFMFNDINCCLYFIIGPDLRPLLVENKRMENTNCNVRCNFIWNGFGRWVNEKWHPFIKG